MTSLLPNRLFILIDPVYYWLSLLHIFISLIIFFSSRISHFAVSCLSDFIKLFFCVFFVPHWVFLKELFWIFFLQVSILGGLVPGKLLCTFGDVIFNWCFHVPWSLALLSLHLEKQSPLPVSTDFRMEIAPISPIRDSEAMSDILWIHLSHTSNFFLGRSFKISWHLLNPVKPGQMQTGSC